ncbi:MAG TPA: DUF393 domain-containing protein [Pirellulaceae bacterium]|nr:DUF393 domain-containing protein [Pirellulaceae bacterium]HMO90670.1 DUF393 domain-containing protein [Pirellulaceae bacterium]HMP67751.1 DUF393 domain-containing protein [Pirellulaceae bacterium]
MSLTKPHFQKDIVIYDGRCKFCTAQIDRLKKWDGRDRLNYVSLHDPQVQEICPDLSHEALMQQMYVIATNGQRYGGAAALRYLSRKLPRMWPLMLPLHIPFSLPLWQWLYNRVAERRYRMGRIDESCESEACSLHFGKKLGPKK